MGLLVRESLDVLVVTETWLKDSDCEWLKSQGLNSLNYKFSSYPRPGRKRGGGLLLIYRKSINLLNAKRLDLQHAEAAVWKLESRKSVFTVLGVYHPPASVSQIANPIFTDALANKLTELIPTTKNSILSGDFNIHVNDLSSLSAWFNM